MQIRSLVVLPAVLLAACAAPAADEPEVTPGATLAEESLGGPYVLPCPIPTVDQTQQLHLGDNCSAEGAVKLPSACDQLVLQYTGILGAGELVLQANLVGPYPQITNQADCEASKISAHVTGELNGQWQTISTLIETGSWGGSYCGFPKFMQGTKMNIPGNQIVDSPYSAVRVATRAVFVTPLGDKAATIRTRAIWYK